MNIDFKIIWFDDASEYIEACTDKVEKIISNFGLRPIIIPYARREQCEMNKLITADLIIADYDLGTSNSVDLVRRIRQNEIVTDVLFYSSKYDEMIKTIKNKTPEIEGFFCAKRGEEMFSKLQMLVEREVKRNQTIEYLRGLITEYATLFDYIIEKSIYELFSLPKYKTHMLKYINTEIAKARQGQICKSCNNDCSKPRCMKPCHQGGNCQNNKQYNAKEITNTQQINEELSSTHKLRVLCNVLATIDAKKFGKLYEDYREHIEQYRNALAHQASEAKELYLSHTKKKIAISESLFIDIRKTICRFYSIFQETIPEVIHGLNNK